MGLTKEADWITFAQAVSSKNIQALEGLGFSVKSLPNGSLSIVEGGVDGAKRYRSPVKKAQQQDATSANIELKPDNITWNEYDARRGVLGDQIAYNNILVEYPDL